MEAEELMGIYYAQTEQSCDGVHNDSDHLDADTQVGHVDNDNHVDQN